MSLLQDRLDLRELQLRPEETRMGGAPRMPEDWQLLGCNGTALTVRVDGGFVMGFNNHFAVLAATVNVGGTQAAPHYIWVEGYINNIASAIIYPTSSATFPDHTDDVWRKPLYQVYIAGATIVCRRLLVLDLKAWLGP
jgi:hypothetical protein